MHRPEANDPTDVPQAREPLLRPDESLAVVRSEEELVLTTRAVARERVRLVKRIVTETVTTTTEVRREELHVERLRADGGEPSPASARGGRLRDRLASLRDRVPSKPAAG